MTELALIDIVSGFNSFVLIVGHVKKSLNVNLNSGSTDWHKFFMSHVNQENRI